MRITMAEKDYASMAQTLEDLEGVADDLSTAKGEIEVLEQDQALLVEALLKWPEFSAWLLTQDNSSSHMSGTHPDCRKQGGVEGMTDLGLALAFAKHITEAR